MRDAARMKLRVLAVVFVGWEVYWLYRYVTSPTPDYEMIGVGALLFAVPPLAIVVLATLLVPFFREYLKAASVISAFHQH